VWAGCSPGDAPSWSAATSFLQAYLAAVWKALVAALLISAALQALVPPSWLPRLLNRRSRLGSAVVGGALSMPSMMCTCCTAPVAVTLRRSGVEIAGTVAYWLGNPLLNPAVLVFLMFVAPWQWTVTRAVVGAITVVLGAVVVAAFAERRRAVAPVEGSMRMVLETPASGGTTAGMAARFLRALGRLSLVLVPEYLVVVLLVGAFRGWLFPLSSSGLGGGVLAVLIAAAVGTMIVIPTAGEIPILTGLALLGLSSGILGALLITLPAVSLPGIAMVARGFGWRATVASTMVVILAGLVGATVLSLL
jgi:uncharacterized membrane protein YraQ (UPF0718 family)